MLGLIFAFIIGISLALLTSFEIISFTGIIFLIIFLLAFFIFVVRYFLNYSWQYILFLLLSLGAGVSDAYLHSNYHPWQLPENLIAKNVPVIGKIQSISMQNHWQTSFILQTTNFNHQHQKIRLHLSWYQKNPPRLLIGSTWRFVLRLKPPHGLHNPGGFDYENWLRLNGIAATGYVVNSTMNTQINSQQHWIIHQRQMIQQDIQKTIKNPNIAAILTALTVGLRDDFSNDMWTVLQNTGTNHLVVIAGLHLGLLVSSLFYMIKFICSCWPRLLLRYPAQKLSAVISLIIAWSYGILAGFSVPTQRALWMISLFMLAKISDRLTASWRCLCLACVLILIFDPLALLTASFWLSFAACAWIAYTLLSKQSRNHCYQLIKIQLAIFLGLIPLTLYYFHQLAFATLLANCLAIPWVGFLIVPLGFIASILSLIHVPGSLWLFKLAGFLLTPLWQFLQKLSAYPGLTWHHDLVNIALLIPAFIGIAILLAPNGFPARWLGIIWLLPIGLYHLPSPHKDELWLTSLDVGQGLSVIIRTKTHNLIYDTGPYPVGGLDSGANIVLPYLRHENIQHIDAMIVSHGDNDHSGGAAAILKTIPVNKLYTSIPSMFPTIPAIHCHQGQHWRWDDWEFQILSPPPQQEYLGNNSSCVLQIHRGHRQILLTGDIEALEEAKLVEKYSSQLQSSLIVVPHHGSITSSSWQFLTKVKPKYALISLGYYNRYHFPSSVVLQRYRQLHAKLYLTSQLGAITAKFKTRGIEIMVQFGKF